MWLFILIKVRTNILNLRILASWRSESTNYLQKQPLKYFHSKCTKIYSPKALTAKQRLFFMKSNVYKNNKLEAMNMFLQLAPFQLTEEWEIY